MTSLALLLALLIVLDPEVALLVPCSAMRTSETVHTGKSTTTFGKRRSEVKFNRKLTTTAPAPVVEDVGGKWHWAARTSKSNFTSTAILATTFAANANFFPKVGNLKTSALRQPCPRYPRRSHTRYLQACRPTMVLPAPSKESS